MILLAVSTQLFGQTVTETDGGRWSARNYNIYSSVGGAVLEWTIQSHMIWLWDHPEIFLIYGSPGPSIYLRYYEIVHSTHTRYKVEWTTANYTSEYSS